MNYAPCKLWRDPPRDALARLDALLAAATPPGPLAVFCRADDVGMGGRKFVHMAACFKTHGLPLALAVVPSWLPLGRARLGRDIDVADPLFSPHQHGFSHRNTAREGKKAEFGDGLGEEETRRRIRSGRDLLRRVLGEAFVPLFTPPWNRCSAATLSILAEEGFRGVSRFAGAAPAALPELMELPVNVDLHIRKEMGAEAQFQGLLDEIGQAVASGHLGLMLHHQRATPASAAFLDALLSRLSERKDTRFLCARRILASF